MRAAALVPLFALAAACREPPRPPPGPPSPIVQVDGGGTSVLAVARIPAGGCPATAPRAALGPGTEHRFEVAGHETWSLEGSPHRAPRGLSVLAGASVTVAPCAVVLVGAGRAFVVLDGASLVAAGTAERPIRFAPDVALPRPGEWQGLEVRARALPTTRLAHVRIEHAGGARAADPLEVAAAIRTAQEPGLALDHVAVVDSAGWGVALTGHAGFAPGATDLVVAGARGGGAVYFADVNRVHSLPPGRYTGNARDDVGVAARTRELTASATWRNPGPGARYRVWRGAHVMVQGAAAPALTIAPGTTVAFEDDAELDVGWDAPGALVADGGNDSDRITFTTARERIEPAAWTGIFLGPHLDVARSRLRWVRIEGAGADSGTLFNFCQIAAPDAADDGMLMVHGVDAASVVERVVFVAGPPRGYAVLRSGDFPGRPGEFTSPSRGNDFSAAGTRCRQSLARLRGECPAEPRCE